MVPANSLLLALYTNLAFMLTSMTDWNSNPIN